MDPCSLVLEVDSLSSSDFTFLLSRVPLENYYQCGFGGTQNDIGSLDGF